MLLPTSYALSFALLIASIVLWGIWANTLKKSGWRFELFYLDYVLGALIGSIALGFTVGSMGTDLSVADSFLLVAKKPIFLAFAAGCIFNLGNMLLVGAVDVAGMAVAFPVTFGLALIVGSIWNHFLQAASSAAMLFGGCALLLVAVGVSGVALAGIEKLRRKAAAAAVPAEEVVTATAPGARWKKADEPRGPSALLGFWLALAGGLVMGACFPVLQMGMEGEVGFSNPFAAMLIFTIAMVISTFVYSLYFMNLPVKGEPVSFFAYFTGSLGQHALGLVGGLIWVLGMAANLAAGAAQEAAKLKPGLSFTLGHGAALVALLCGLLVWKEFREGSASKIILAAVLFASGLALVALAQ